MEVIHRRRRQKFVFFLLPCDYFVPRSKQSTNGRFKYRYTGSLSTLSDLTYCRDRKLYDTIVSHPKHVFYDLLPQQRQRGGWRDRGHNFIIPNVCIERFDSFRNRDVFFSKFNFLLFQKKALQVWLCSLLFLRMNKVFLSKF